MGTEATGRTSAPPPVWYLGQPTVPIRAVVLSLVALLIPIGATLVVPEASDEYQVLLWLLLLVPAFLLAYFRGWRGIAAAMALGMVAMVTVQTVMVVWGFPPAQPSLLIGVVVAYVMIAVGIGFLSDELHQARMFAEELALTDELTGLPNRRYTGMTLEREFAAAQRGRPLIIVSFDLDRFKDYNDRFGHTAGDEALHAFGSVLAKNTRAMNISGRWGGEEFLALVSNADVAGSLVFVERVRDGFRRHKLKQGSLTVCVGVAVYNSSMQTIDDLLIAADIALYEAKAAGPDSVRVYQPPAAVARPA